jgi:hypothetical protein
MEHLVGLCDEPVGGSCRQDFDRAGWALKYDNADLVLARFLRDGDFGPEKAQKAQKRCK